MSPTKAQDPKKMAGKPAGEAAVPKPPKDPFTIQWKWLGIGVVVGMLLFLFMRAIGARPTEVDLLGLKFSLPSSASTPVATQQTTPIPGAVDDPLLGVALAALKYTAGGWDPRSIDLTKAAGDGIYVNDGYSLRLYDLWVSVPPDVSGYKGQMEIYAQGEVIGRSGLLDLQPGGTLFKDIYPTNYKHPTVDNAWVYRSEWEQIDIGLIVYSQGKAVGGTVAAQLRINNTGKAWFFTPPYAHIVSVIYHVNNGPAKSLDLSTAADTGLGVKPGDTLTIEKIWYKASGAEKDQSMRAEVYFLAPDGNDDGMTRSSSWVTFEQGSRELLNGTSLTWESIPADRNHFLITLVRDDYSILDRVDRNLIAAESGSNSDMLVGPDVANWPADTMRYLDFEKDADLNAWSGTDFSQVSLASAEVYSGNRALGVTVSGNTEDGLVVQWNQNFQPEVIVGQVYWPRQEGIEVQWASICASACVPVTTYTDHWNTFVMDFSELTADGVQLNTKELGRLWMIAGIKGDSPEKAYTFFIDGIQIYPVIKE
jgi:hypothetical protein